jgi:hypothetical protein
VVSGKNSSFTGKRRMGQYMTTDNDQVHGTVIDPGYSPEPESSVQPGAAPAEHGEEELSPSDMSAQDDGEELSPSDLSAQDDDDGVIVVESNVPGEVDGTDAADDEVIEPAATPVTADAGTHEAALPDGPGGTDQETAGGRHAAGPSPAEATQVADVPRLAGDADEIRRRWAAIQSGFVDDPRESVAEAAAFASEVMTALLAKAKEQEQALHDEWDHEGADTEDLRVVIRRYRAFLDQLAAL